MLPTKLRHFVREYKASFLVLSLASIPIMYYSWDKYNTKRILAHYILLSKSYGDAPLSHNLLPTKLSFLVEGVDREELAQKRKLFNEFVEPVLTAAGLEYEWIEASMKKHHQELFKLLSLSEAEIKEKSLNQITNFTKINSWRLNQWLTTIFDKIEGEKQAEAEWSRRSIFSKVVHYLGITTSSTHSAEPLHLNKKGLVDSNNDIKEGIEKTLHLLAPPPPPLTSFQQGMIIFGKDEEFSSIFETLAAIATDRYITWSEIFRQFPFRLGAINPMHQEPLIKRLFNKRSIAKSLASSAFDLASDHFLQLDSEAETRLLFGKRNSINKPLYSHEHFPKETILLLAHLSETVFKLQ